MPCSPVSIPVDARWVTVPFERLRRWLDGYAVNHPQFTAHIDTDTIQLSSADNARAWISVPFPPMPMLSTTDVLPELIHHAERMRTIGVLLVRRKGHAAGIFRGSELLVSKVGSSYVQGRTKAGGWSQKRYSRRRDNQAQVAFDEAAAAAVRVFTDNQSMESARLCGGNLVALIVGGDRRAVESVLDDPRLAAVRPLVQGPFLNVADPRLKVLRETPSQFLSLRIALHP